MSKRWQVFHFESFYYGNHEEQEEGDRTFGFLFHPSVDLSQWMGVNFGHGHFSCHEQNREFARWLNQIPRRKKYQLFSLDSAEPGAKKPLDYAVDRDWDGKLDHEVCSQNPHACILRPLRR